MPDTARSGRQVFLRGGGVPHEPAGRSLVRRLADAVMHHACMHWPAAIFVAAAVAFIHHEFGWLDAIDRYAYLVLGHLSSQQPIRSPDTVLVRIDGPTHASVYRDRSPLDRCQLEQHLGLIYDADPRLLVVDLDLSPALWLHGAAETERERRCESALYQLIDRHGAKTILMEPIPFGEARAGLPEGFLKDRCEWKKNRRAARVLFGNPEIIIESGLVVRSIAEPDSLARLAVCRAGAPPGSDKCSDRNETECECLCEIPHHGTGAHSKMLDFRLVPKEIVLGDLIGTAPEYELSAVLNDKVVFLGATYGFQDRFLTLQDEKYGVELHALAFLSEGRGINDLHDRWGQLFKLLLDVLVAFVFGAMISRIWRSYLQAHASESSRKRESAFLYVLLLLGSLVFVLLVVLWSALQLLMYWGIWLSPVPIALGMLIESFAAGSTAEAVHMLEQRNASRHIAGHEALSCKSPAAFFYRDWYVKASSVIPDERAAAVWILVRRLLWLWIVVATVYPILTNVH
jgi:hypothetical protein